MQQSKLDFSKIEDIEFDGIDWGDAPDFCDAYISAATIDGREATEEELEAINEDSDFVHQELQNYLY